MLFLGLGFEIVYILIALLVALSFHEASHALVAYWLGDDTPKKMGRLSLNPFAHLHPIGTLMILFVGIGFGKPVQIDAGKLRPGPKIGMALVAIAGPITNILLAIVVALPLRFHLVSLLSEKIFVIADRAVYFSTGTLIQWMVSFSLALAVFNLIPISPLDGSRLWQILLPTRWYYVYARYEILGMFLVIGLVLATLYLRLGFLNQVICPPVEFLWQPIVGFGHSIVCG